MPDRSPDRVSAGGYLRRRVSSRLPIAAATRLAAVEAFVLSDPGRTAA